MFDSIFSTIISGTVTPAGFLICSGFSIVLGLAVAFIHRYKNRAGKNFTITLALLPIIIQVVITLVNGNLGTGVAVMGAFSLVRFRSIPGSAKDIGSIFLAMAVGLATGMGYVGIAAVFVAVVSVVNMLYVSCNIWEQKSEQKILRLTIPEGLDYTGVFDDLFAKYTRRHELISVKTVNMGSLYKLEYTIELIDAILEKSFLDDLRCRNGNLEIMCSREEVTRDEL